MGTDKVAIAFAAWLEAHKKQVECEKRLKADVLDEWPRSWNDAPLGPPSPGGGSGHHGVESWCVRPMRPPKSGSLGELMPIEPAPGVR